jgi:hypothetical protein
MAWARLRAWALAAATALASVAPATGQAPFGCDSVLTLVVGDGSTPTVYGKAQVVSLQERTRTGTLLQTIPLLSDPTSGAPACTLGVNKPEGAVGVADQWQYNTDGVPSLSADGASAVLFCFRTMAGDDLAMDADKTVAVVFPNGTVVYSAALSGAYTGVFGPSGIRQAASDDGSRFWLAGMASND